MSMSDPRTSTASRPGRQRTAAHASNQLLRKNVKPLLSIVGGRRVSNDDDGDNNIKQHDSANEGGRRKQPPPQQQHKHKPKRLPTPEDIDASPKSSTSEEDDGRRSAAVAPTRTSPSPVSRSKASSDKSSARRDLSSRSALRKEPDRHNQRPHRRRGRASDEASESVAPALQAEDEEVNIDDELFPVFMSSSQPAKRKYRSSQSVDNMHAPATKARKAEDGQRQTAKSSFQVPAGLAHRLSNTPPAKLKVPRSMLTSPSSSAPAVFRIPSSSTGAIPPSSDLLCDSDSTLSSAPPTPELEAAERAIGTVVDGKVMVACPLCKTLVLKRLLDSFATDGILRWKDKIEFCQLHKGHDAEQERQVRQYPTIEWASFPARLKRFMPTIGEILERRKESFYRNMLDEKVASGRERNAFRTVDHTGQENTVPGYYGLKGARLMQHHILAAFASKIRRLASTDKAIPRTGPTGYVSAVLVPEMAVLLVMEDFPDIDQEQARGILSESVEVGKLIDDDDNDDAVS